MTVKNCGAICLLMLCLFRNAVAQTPFLTRDSINIGNINASVLVHGDMWWNPQTAQTACYLYGLRPGINFASAVWMSGYDAGNNLHVAAQTYRQHGNDYWPGPLDGSATLSYATSRDWAKIWKINRTDIDSFLTLSAHTLSNTPASILTWPGKGNLYATGNGVPLTVTTDMAPFVDVNSNGIYEPLMGDYPDVKGDQTLWWVFSDNGPTHSQTNAHPLGVEVHAMAYAFHRGTLIDNVVYYEYTLVNRSANNYHDFRFAIWDDIVIVYAYNDYIGFDSTWRMGIGYTSGSHDTSNAGHPINSYNPALATVGVIMIRLPGDVGTSYVPVGSFDYCNRDTFFPGTPVVDTEYNNYMHAKMRNGRHFRNDFAGAGIPSNGIGPGPDCNYLFTGDPGDRSQWSECVCGNNPSLRQFILSSNDFTLNSGSTEKILIALLAIDTFHGCPSTSFDSIRVIADTAWRFRDAHGLSPVRLSYTYSNSYPNPAHDKLNIETSAAADITVLNMLGGNQQVVVAGAAKGYEIDISQLPPGMYYLRYRDGENQVVSKFVKN